MLYCVPLCSCGNCDIRHMVTWITPLVGEDKQMQRAILQGILCQLCCHQGIFCRSVNLIRWQPNMGQTGFVHFETRSIISEEWHELSHWGGKPENEQRVKFAKWIRKCQCQSSFHSCTMSWGLPQVLPGCTSSVPCVISPSSYHTSKNWIHSSKMFYNLHRRPSTSYILLFLCKHWNFSQAKAKEVEPLITQSLLVPASKPRKVSS